jgi:hypothetical protein
MTSLRKRKDYYTHAEKRAIRNMTLEEKEKKIAEIEAEEYLEPKEW